MLRTNLVVKLVEQVAARTVTVSLTVLPETAVPMLNWTDPFPAPSLVPVYVNVVVLYAALIEIGALSWFDLTVTVSFEFLIGVGFEIDAVQVACCPVAAVIVVPAGFVVATANVVTAFVDDGTDAVVCANDRVVGKVLGGLVPLPPQPANPAANATDTAANQQLRTNNLTNTAPRRHPSAFHESRRSTGQPARI